jgi:hypothetical protein
MKPLLRFIMTRPPGPDAPLLGSPDVRGDAAAALEAVLPSAVTDTELWDLMNGTESQRAGAAIVVARRKRPDSIHILAALARDQSEWVQAVVANQLMEWMREEIAAEAASTLVRRILASGGTLVARMVAVRLDGLPRTDAADRIVDTLQNHASAFSREQIEAYRSNISDTSPPSPVAE